MDDDLRRLLLNIVDRIDAQVPRLDAIDAQLKRLDAIDARLTHLDARIARLDATVSAQGDQLRTLSDAVAVIAGIQANTSKALGDLTQQVARLVEGNVRGRTGDAQRYAELEARVAELETQVRALVAGPAR
jgi:uncharacterized coiled-coil protein SlyX